MASRDSARLMSFNACKGRRGDGREPEQRLQGELGALHGLVN